MTAKEKAKNLVDRMERSKEMPYQYAKQCALIAVDEIISIKLLWYQKDTKELDYWQEVKSEIKQL